MIIRFNTLGIFQFSDMMYNDERRHTNLFKFDF